MAKRYWGDVAVAVAYLRVSTDGQDLGVDAQRAAIEVWAAARGVQVVAWCEDRGVCGATPIDKRAGLLEALGALREHGAGLLVVAKRDRLARDTLIAAMVERMAIDAGATVASAAGEGEGSGPEAQLMRSLVDAFAQYERALIVARTTAALRVKAARGERVGAVPYGKRLVDDGRRSKASGAACGLAAHDGEQATIAAARELRDAGRTMRAIGAELDARGLRSRSGRPWQPMQIARVLA